MARTSSLPEDVLRFKPGKCCRIRNDNGVYRVYKYSSVKLSSGQWSNDYGYLIGKIIPGEGFFPNKRYQKELSEQYPDSFPDGITDVAYGQYALYISSREPHLHGEIATPSRRFSHTVTEQEPHHPLFFSSSYSNKREMRVCADITYLSAQH